MDDWVTFNDELTRKVAAEVDKWASTFDRGVLSKREFYIVISALYDATSGLVSREMSKIMADIHADLRKKK